MTKNQVLYQAQGTQTKTKGVPTLGALSTQEGHRKENHCCTTLKSRVRAVREEREALRAQKRTLTQSRTSNTGSGEE